MRKMFVVLVVLSFIMGTSFCGFAEDNSGIVCSDWAKEEIERAIALGFTDADLKIDYSAPLTREGFCEPIYNMMVKIGYFERWYNERTNGGTQPLPPKARRPFDDTDNFAVNGLYQHGIVEGKSLTEFAPADYLTREETATILSRLVNIICPEWKSDNVNYEFSDSDHISDWAKDSVNMICNIGIMKGMDNGSFCPDSNLSFEQALITVIRVYDGYMARNTKPVDEKLTFADKLNNQMPDDKNYMFSPFSVKMALMMAANGASGETLDETISVLNVSDVDTYNKNARALIDKYCQSDAIRIDVSNSIWINSDCTLCRFSDAYKSKLLKNFDATSEIVNNKNALEKINGWVSEKTENKITEIITKDTLSFEAMLINAVYFNAAWKENFNKDATSKEIFTSGDGTTTEIDFMHRTDNMNYCESDGVKIVELEYSDFRKIYDENGKQVKTERIDGVDISMYLMMSDNDFSPEKILSGADFSSQRIALSMPKFKIEYGEDIMVYLKAIGLEKTFASNANFEKMFANGNMFIDSVIHKSYIDVYEEGTEAAAVTAIAMKGSGIANKPVEVKYNKPFTFVIKDNASGELLFVGEFAYAPESNAQ